MSERLKFFVIVACVCAFIASCAENSPNEINSSDTAATVTTDTLKVTVKDSMITMAADTPLYDTTFHLLAEWKKQLQSKGKKFYFSNFYTTGTTKIRLSDCNYWNGVIDDWYGASPDSMMFGEAIPGWNGGEPDTYLYLLNRKNKTRCYLDGAGTPATFEDCEWVSNDVLIAYGYDNYLASEKYPDKDLVQGFYVVYNLKTMEKNYYLSMNFFSLH